MDSARPTCVMTQMDRPTNGRARMLVAAPRQRVTGRDETRGYNRSVFDEQGYLAPGFHDWTLQDVRSNLVEAFGAEGPRPVLYDGLLRLRTAMVAVGAEGRQWLDGSFSTAKGDPGDIDLLSVFEESLINGLPASAQNQIAQLTAGPETKASHGCDSYICISVPEDHPRYAHYRQLRTYWLGEFGFDREDQPKGIVRVPLPCHSGPVIREIRHDE